jgi:hypothetical protein
MISAKKSDLELLDYNYSYMHQGKVLVKLFAEKLIQVALFEKDAILIILVETAVNLQR